MSSDGCTDNFMNLLKNFSHVKMMIKTIRPTSNSIMIQQILVKFLLQIVITYSATKGISEKPMEKYLPLILIASHFLYFNKKTESRLYIRIKENPCLF